MLVTKVTTILVEQPYSFGTRCTIPTVTETQAIGYSLMTEASIFLPPVRASVQLQHVPVGGGPHWSGRRFMTDLDPQHFHSKSQPGIYNHFWISLPASVLTLRRCRPQSTARCHTGGAAWRGPAGRNLQPSGKTPRGTNCNTCATKFL